MIKINSWKVLFNWVDITDQPVLRYATVNWKRLLPSEWEKRENRIDCVDENEWLFEVYFNWDLQCFVRWCSEAKKYLQELVDAEDYYNGNEKIDEFYIG